MPIQIRLATADDIPAIGRVRREVWFAVYSGILDHDIIDRVTAPGCATADPPAYRRSYVAVERAADGTPTARRTSSPASAASRNSVTPVTCEAGACLQT